jgi:hypothetical protein
MHNGEKVMEGAPRSLLSENLEPFVLESRGEGKADRAAGQGSSADFRIEATREGVRVFSRDHGALVALAAELGAGESDIRATNLEDLFLRATGSSLDE